MYNTADNIVALATLAGKSALNIVRVSGSSSSKIYQQLTKTSSTPQPNLCVPKNIYGLHADRPLDHGMIVYYRAPKSFTGEHSIEIIIHGGIIIVDKLIEAIVAMGARIASPGEFSYRAYLNNKIDLIQAEAIASIVSAQNSIDSFYYLNAIKGNLSNSIIKYNKQIDNIITLGEHELNFSDDEITKTQSAEYMLKIKAIKANIDTIISRSYTVESTLSTVRVAIIGKPNAGKSSLFNILVGKSRSIVTNQRGTTRDTIESDIYIGGILIKLVDTAGIRVGKTKIEKIGIVRAYEEIDRAQIVIIIDDNSPEEIKNKLELENKSMGILLVNNKSDLKPMAKKQSKEVHISCKNNKGIDLLSTELLTLCKGLEDNFFKSFTYLINQRQIILLKRISKELDQSIINYKATLDLTIFISSLYAAQQTFNTLVRPNDRDAILNNIFKGFCVGK